MPNKSILELIEEAQELDINVHEHVAQEVFGTVDAKTRQQAKILTFSYLYGGTGRLSSNEPNIQSIPVREPSSGPRGE